jgi:4'-phosphopantetheinyl transferase
MTVSRWPRGPEHPQLGDGAVHVWRADLASVARELRGLLCADERERAARFVKRGDGELWSSARGLLRALLGRYLERDPRALRFAIGEHGKPALVGEPLSFNMSHSGGVAVYAFGAAGAVGVDVEVARRPVDELAIAARMFDPAQSKRLQELAPASRGEEFLRMWTCHEAELKCMGTGIGQALGSGERRPWVRQLDVGPGAAAAVASERAAAELRCWEWPA